MATNTPMWMLVSVGDLKFKGHKAGGYRFINTFDSEEEAKRFISEKGLEGSYYPIKVPVCVCY